MTARLWGSQISVNTTTANNQQSPTIATLSDGNFIVTWHDPSSGGSVLGQYYSPAGLPIGGEFAIGTGIQADVTALGNGAAEIAYVTGSTINRRFIGAGGGVGAENQVDINAQNPVIGGAADGSFAVAYVQNNDILLSRYDTAGVLLNVVTVNTTVTGNQVIPDIVRLASFQYAIAWLDTNLNQIRIRVADDTSGFATGTDIGVVGVGAAPNNPDLTPLARGNFLLTYTSFQAGYPGESLDIHAVVLDPQGTVQSDTVLVNTFTTGQQRGSAAVGLPDGRFLVTWFDSSTSIDRVKAQVFFPDGAKDGREVLISGTSDASPGSNGNLDAALLPDGRVAITWTQNTAPGDADVRLQIVDPRDGFIEGTSAVDTLFGSDIADQIVALEGSDTVFAGAGGDIVYGGTGDDTINGDDGDDLIYGEDGSDTVQGGAGNDVIFGGIGNDTLRGGFGDDTLNGGKGDDSMFGGVGSDIFAGGLGHDTLQGGLGFADTFRYQSAADSNIASNDFITDFEHGSDKIDLSFIRVTGGTTVSIQSSGGVTFVNVDLNADGSNDMHIQALGNGVLDITDIILPTVNAGGAAVGSSGPGAMGGDYLLS